MVDYHIQKFRLRGKSTTATELLIEMLVLYSRCWLRGMKDHLYNSYSALAPSKARKKDLAEFVLSCSLFSMPKPLLYRIAQESMRYMSKYVDFKFIMSKYQLGHDGSDISTEEGFLKYLVKQLRHRGLHKMFGHMKYFAINEEMYNSMHARQPTQYANAYATWNRLCDKWQKHSERILIKALNNKRIPNTFVKDYLRNRTIFCRERILGFSKFYKAAQET